MVQPNYYTGIIFRGFTHGVALFCGGRCDNLEKFGERYPYGFFYWYNLVMNALERQRVGTEKPVTV